MPQNMGRCGRDATGRGRVRSHARRGDRARGAHHAGARPGGAAARRRSRTWKGRASFPAEAAASRSSSSRARMPRCCSSPRWATTRARGKSRSGFCARELSVHAARRGAPHTRDVVMITPDGERTIVVVGEPLHPERADALPWESLAECDAAYFTAQDPAALVAARAARVLLVTARRRAALLRSGVRPDVVVGSAVDPREACTLADFPPGQRPAALVLTEGAAGGAVYSKDGVQRFPAAAVAARGGWFVWSGRQLRRSAHLFCRLGAAGAGGVRASSPLRRGGTRLGGPAGGAGAAPDDAIARMMHATSSR